MASTIELPSLMSKASEQREHEIALRILHRWHDDVPNDRMAHLVKDTTRAFLRALQDRLSKHDVQFGHWTFLRILWERDGLTKRELSAEAGVMEPTTFSALQAMEALGYVTLERRANNRKNIYVFLTPLGKRLRKTLVPLAEEVNEVAVHRLSPDEVATTRHALLVMLDNLTQDQEGTAAP